MNPIEIIQKAKQRKAEREWLIRIHHILMKEYGWIPLEEFRKLPMPTVWNLLNQIQEQKEAEERAMQKAIKKPRIPRLRK